MNLTEYSATQPSTPDQRHFDPLDGHGLFFATRIGHQGILKILPEPAVPAEVDLNRDLLAPLIGKELNALHFNFILHPGAGDHLGAVAEPSAAFGVVSLAVRGRGPER